MLHDICPSNVFRIWGGGQANPLPTVCYAYGKHGRVDLRLTLVVDEKLFILTEHLGADNMNLDHVGEGRVDEL